MKRKWKWTGHIVKCKDQRILGREIEEGQRLSETRV